MKADETLFSKIGPQSRLTDRVVEAIQDLIINGQLKPGMKLPSEQELVEQFGVSRTVVREAVRILMARGLLKPKRGVGTIVQRMTRDQVVKPLSLLVQIESGGVSFEELHQVRSILEVEIAGLAAAHATEADIVGLQQIAADMEENLGNLEIYAARDADFHQALARATHNPLLDLLVGVIRDLLEGYFMEARRYLGHRLQGAPRHRHLLERVAARDTEGARQAMRELLRLSEETMRKLSAASEPGNVEIE